MYVVTCSVAFFQLIGLKFAYNLTHLLKIHFSLNFFLLSIGPGQKLVHLRGTLWNSDVSECVVVEAHVKANKSTVFSGLISHCSLTGRSFTACTGHSVSGKVSLTNWLHATTAYTPTPLHFL